MTDELPTASRVSDPGIRALYTQENRWQSWLDVEAALAKAEAELGIVPAAAADAIAQKARLDLLDRAHIDEGFARTGHTIVPLVWELSRVVGEPHGGWVHWGATTQNITQTGDLLVLRDAHRVLLRLIGEALSAMADLAERGADMPIAGRTHGQHAVPATFGYKPAVWIDEMIRHVERLRQAAPRLFVAMLGGGAGTFASLGAHGPRVQEGIGRLLGMVPMRVPARTIGDHLAENICLFGLVAATAGKIAREIYTLMKTEFGEVEEPVPPGTVGSSTMPQKRNPISCELILAAAKVLRQQAGLVLDAMVADFERATGPWHVEWVTVPEAFGYAAGALHQSRFLLGGLIVDPVRMARNLAMTHGLIVAEAVMMGLAPYTGRTEAHDLVYDACHAAIEGDRPLLDVLLETPAVAGPLGPDKLRALTDPANYLGAAPAMVDHLLARR